MYISWKNKVTCIFPDSLRKYTCYLTFTVNIQSSWVNQEIYMLPDFFRKYTYFLNIHIYCDIYTLWVKKWALFHLSITFANTVPILIIVHCCRQKLYAHKHIMAFSILPIVCCCTTLKNAAAYTSSQKLLNKSAMHLVIPLLLQSKKF